MANQDKSVINLQITGDAKQLEKVLKSVGDTLGKNLSTSLETSLVKAATKFANTLGKSMQASFDEGIVKALTKPIVLKIDTKDAQTKIDKLVDPLLKLSTQINKLENLASSFSSTPAGGKKQTTSSASSLSQKDQIDIRNQVNAELAAARKSLRTGKTNDPLLIKAGEDKIDKLNSLSNQLKGIDKSGAYTDAQINKLIKIREEIKKLTTDLQANQDTLKTARAAFANSEATIDDFGAQIQEVVDKLGLLNVAEKDIDATTKKARNSFETLKEQFNLLGDELKKQSPNFALIERTIKNIQGRTTPVLQSRINTLSQNRQGIIDPAVDNVGKKEQEEQLKRQKLLALQNIVTEKSIEDVERALEGQRLAASKLGPPLNLVNKQTSNYEKSLVDVRKKLQDVNTQFQKGEITLEQAISEYERLNKQLRQTAIGINQIDPQKLKRAFDLEQSDPRQLSYRLGILGFTLNTVSSSLVNFSRNTFNLLNQLAVFAEPIERVNNALALQVKQGQLTVEQQGIVLRKLRDIGDLPGSSVEDANATFNALQKVNVSLKTRLDLTEGIAKIAASPGGTPDSAKQFADVIAAISLEKVVDEDRFKTLRRSGGTAITKLIDELGFAGGKDIEEFGVVKFIEKVGESLKKLEEPAATTGDRINRLKSRAAELGLILGKALGPGLDNLNTFLKDSVEPAIKRLGQAFDNLSPAMKNFISTGFILIPVIAGISGAFIGVAASIGFAVSGLKQIAELGPIAARYLGTGATAATAVGTGTAITASRAGSAIGTARSVGIVGGLAPGAALAGAGVGGAATATGIAALTTEGTKALGVIGKLGNALKVLTGPIGIVINLLLSVFGALFSNFANVRDRLILVFSQLDEEIDKLLVSLGIGPGGLLKVLGFIGDAISGIFNVIGTQVINVLITIVQSLKDVLTGINNVIAAFRDEGLLSGFSALIKGLANIVTSFFRNIGINIISTIFDALASAFESTIGGGIISERFRVLSNDLRKNNQTDNNSILNNEAKKRELKLIQDQKDKEKELEDDRKTNEEARLKRVITLRTELRKLTDETKNEFKKFKSEQDKSTISETIDILNNNSTKIFDLYKSLVDNLTDINSISNLYNNTLKTIKKNQEEIISQKSAFSLIDAKSQFLDLADENGKLKIIYELAKSGDEQFKSLVESINKVGQVTSIDSLNSALAELDEASKKINPKGIDGKFYVNILNITERTRAVLAKNNIDINKTLIEQRNLLVQAKNLEIDRLANLKIEENNRKLQLEEIKEQGRQKKLEIERDRQKILDQRKGEFVITQQQKDQEERLRIDEDAIIALRNKNKVEIENLAIDINRQIEKVNLDPEILNEDDRNSKREGLRNSFFTKEKELNNLLKEQIRIYKELKSTTQSLYGEQNKNTILKFYSDIYNSIRSVTNITSRGLEQLFRGFSKLISSKDKKDNASLISVINNLISSGDISELSNTGDELKRIIDDIDRGVTTFERSYSKLIEIISEDGIKTASDNAERSLRKLNESIKNYNNSTSTNPINEKFTTFEFGDDEGKADLSRKSASATLLNLVGRSFDSENGSNLKFLTEDNENLVNLRLLSTKLNVLGNKEDNITAKNIRDILLSSISNKKEGIDKDSYIEIYENIFSELLDVKSEKELERVLEIIFQDSLGKDNNDEGRSEIILNLINAIKSNEELLIKSTTNKIDTELKISEAFAKNELQKIENKIQDANLNNQDLTEKIVLSKTTKERRDLKKQQEKILLDLIDFNYRKLDIDLIFTTRAAVINAKGDEDEIKRIKEAGLKKRTELLNQRNLELKEQVLSSGGKVVNGKLVGADGKEVAFSKPITLGDFSKGTDPDVKDPVFSRAETITNSVQEIRKELGLLSDEAVEAANSVLDLFNSISSGEGVINSFKRIITSLGTNLKSLGEVFKNLAVFGVGAFGQAMADALADSILNGENFLKSLGKFFGEILVTLGKTLVQLGIAALAMYALSKIPGLRGVTGSPDVSLAGAAIATAAGVGLMLAGKALGAGSAGVSNTGTTNTANSATGASGDTNYNPETDPLSIYQKALRAEIYLDIRTDDSQIIRSVVKGVNRNQKLSELIGNNRLGFSI